MKMIEEIGQPSWTDIEIKNTISEFLEIYEKRPFKVNEGGMKAPHMFATWFMLKELNPSTVIESGVWKGLGTWIIEKAVPNAKIYSIDPVPEYRIYDSPNANYFVEDFSLIDWSFIGEKERCMLFFDDHQNALKRVRKAKHFGFKHLIFEDNYPPKQGDCYSLKKAFSHAGFRPEGNKITGIRSFISSFRNDAVVAPNERDSEFLKSSLELYYEFPPIIKTEKTRWGDKWDMKDYPTKPAIYQDSLPGEFKVLKEEAQAYTWICYAKLK